MRLIAKHFPACDGEPGESWHEWTCNCGKDNVEPDYRDELTVSCSGCFAEFVVTEFDFDGDIVKRDDPTGFLEALEKLEGVTE